MAFTFHYYPRTSGSGHSGSGFKASCAVAITL